ncbi:MAG: hypothetical protein IAI49_07300, partial [Candidatus Eremiobacteraeota bacterium]|nr:hypothetical protein [Candidatus Eremiobacteraeota bacterium]
ADAFDLFVFYEVFSVAAYALSAYRVEVKSAYQGALQFALVNSIAGLFILGGIIFLEARTGELNLVAIGRSLGAQHAAMPLVATAFAFLAVGLFTRGALAPLHFWFDEVHGSAPTPLCVVLSGAMVPLAIYGFMRIYLIAFSSVLPPEAGPAAVATAIGVLSAVAGAVMCLRQPKLKRMLAFATVAHGGVALAALGSFEPATFAGVGLYLASYAAAGSGVFMAVAIVRSRTGSEVDILSCAGAGRRLYLTGTIFALGTCGVAGLWPAAHALLAAERGGGPNVVLVAVSTFVGAATGGALLRAFWTIFVRGENPQFARRSGNVPWFMLTPAFALLLLPLLSFVPHVADGVSLAASDFLDVRRYRALELGEVMPAAPAAARASFVTPLVWLSPLGALFVGWFAIARTRSLRLVRLALGRNRTMKMLAAIHDGDVGRYVAWIVATATAAA